MNSPTTPQQASKDSMGRFEISRESFAEKMTGRAQDLAHPLNVKEVIPGLFTGTSHMPRLLGKGRCRPQ